MRSKRIRNSRDLRMEIARVKLEKEVKRQQVLAGFDMLKNKLYSAESGFKAAREAYRIFRGAQDHQRPPLERIRNIGLNFAIDWVAQYLTDKAAREADQ